MEKEAAHFHRLNEEWLAILEDVRQLEGFQDFMRPRHLSTLQAASKNGPVVILNASETGCAALVLTSTGVHHVPFPNLNFKKVTKLVELLRHAIAHGGRDAPLPESSCTLVEGFVHDIPFVSGILEELRMPIMPLERSQIRRVSNVLVQPDDIFRFILGVLWKSVAEPVICLLDLQVSLFNCRRNSSLFSHLFQKSDFPSKLWWCRTGPFAFLPIHAAGLYLPDSTESVSGYVDSSYTPTINSLLGDIPISTNSFKMMAVIQPDTPCQRPLPCTVDELHKIEAMSQAGI